MDLLPVNASNEVLGATVLASLKGARDGLTEQEWDAQTAKALGLLGEQSWNTIEKNWDHIYVYKINDDTINVVPMARHEGGGYGTRESDPIYTCKSLASEIGEAIRRGLDGPAPCIEDKSKWTSPIRRDDSLILTGWGFKLEVWSGPWNMVLRQSA
jgi:hypothetical protein